MLKLFLVPEPFLKENYFVHFTSGWEVSAVRGKFFKIDRAVQVPFKVFKIVNAGATYSHDFEANGLMPESDSSLYEIACGFSGSFILEPDIGNVPSLKLEKSGFVSDLADVNRRYLGTYTEKDTPFDSPRLRVITVAKMQSVTFKFYCDSIDYEKLRVNFIVNRCRIVPPSAEELDKLKRGVLPYRKIVYYKEFEW